MHARNASAPTTGTSASVADATAAATNRNGCRVFPPPEPGTFVCYFLFGQRVRIWDLESPHCGEEGLVWSPSAHQQLWRVDLDDGQVLSRIAWIDLEPVWS